MKLNYFFGFILALLLTLHSPPAPGQYNHIRFERLTINDGLSLSSVYIIFQDSKGFMWFGTEDGLNKYDGKEFRIYRPDPGNENALSYKWTEMILEDHRGKFWFGSKGGLSLFDPINETFINYRSQTSDKTRLSSDTIRVLYQKGENEMWIGTKNGINVINMTSGHVLFSGLKGKQVNAIYQNGGDLWIGTNQGIFVKKGNEAIDPLPINTEVIETKIVMTFAQDQNDNLWTGYGNKLIKLTEQGKPEVISAEAFTQLGQIEKLIFDSDSNLWISCSNGLFKYSLTQTNLTQIVKSIDSSHSLAINPSKSIILDKKGMLWYGTFGQGIFRIDTKNNRVYNFRNNPGDIHSISENSINCIYEDNTGNIWLGTFGAGINIYLPQAHKFGFISHQPMNPNSLSSNFIWSIMECENENLWIGTNDAGLNIYNPFLNTYEVFMHNPKNPKSISHSSIREVYQDSKNRIWIGTDGGGLNLYNSDNKSFIHYQNEPGNPKSISGNSVRVVYEDRENRLWIGTRSGLNLFDPASGIFKRYTHHEGDPQSLSNNFIYSAIHHDQKGDLWIGTYGGGLNRLDITTGQFEHFIHDRDNPKSISDNIVFSIHEDKKGNLWVGTNSGLDYFEPINGSFTRYGIKDGLPNEVIYGILPDDSGHLWLSTNKGICRFNISDYSTKNFSINDGLQSNEFNGGAFHKGLSGKMYFGGVYGLNIIDPDLTYIEENNSKIVITGMAILGNEVQILPDSLEIEDKNQIVKLEDNYYLHGSIAYTDTIILDYHNRFISIEFAALNSPAIENLHFQYMLEELDNNWYDIGNRTYVTFANLQAGKYTLKIRSFNVDKFQGAADAELNIFITPPFWKTWWFYLIEGMLALVILFFVYKYLLKIRTNRLLKTQNERIYQANKKLLESENNLKHLNATKDKFFSIISHDLKNPFTSLLSISELMAGSYADMDDEDKAEGVKRIHNSATRIYDLLENLLTWSRAQSGRINFNPTSFSLNEIVNENISLLHHSAVKKNIKLEAETIAALSAYGDRDMINTVIRNLLGNAIKFSPSDKSIKVKIDDDMGFWKVSIIDEGVGMSEENQEKIFHIDTKFKTEGTMGEKGTGLGLLICKEFVLKNGGAIQVKSVLGKGSTFSFTIPKNSGFVK
jgi:ligand-binding sensor domain-containing protein/signal transduction histidine kinase